MDSVELGKVRGLRPVSWLLVGLFLLAMPMLVACGSSPDAKANGNLTPLLRDKDKPLDVRIANIQKDPNIPGPEKDRAIGILRAEAAAHPPS